MNIERIQPLLTIEQLIRILELAVSSKTNEMEITVARSLEMLLMPPIMVSDDPSLFANLKPGEIRRVSDDD
jgi:hypothetical protein